MKFWSLTLLLFSVLSIKQTIGRSPLIRQHHVINEKNAGSNVHGFIYGKNDPILRTCSEYFRANGSLPTGTYLIDPDGVDVGDPAFEVECDMQTGTTRLHHNSEPRKQVSSCLDPGCYSHPVTYDTTMNQIAKLKRLSESCSQRIQYECKQAPFEFNGIDYSWWNNIKGENRYYWEGSNNTGHTCQCGIDGSCIDPVTKCNCDAYLADLQRDTGFITNKDDLPVTRLNFGKTNSASSEGYHTLGYLECHGFFNGIPTSCEDVWSLGHLLSGFYTIQKNGIFQLVFCDMTKQHSEGMEIFQGVIEAKYPKGILFDAYNTKPSTGPTKLKYETVNAQGCDVTDGSFTAPKNGIYSFSFLSFTTTMESKADIVVNDRHTIGSSIVSTNGMDTLSVNALTYLNASDTVAVYLIGGLGTGNGAAYTHFSGALLDESTNSLKNFSP